MMLHLLYIIIAIVDLSLGLPAWAQRLAAVPEADSIWIQGD